MRSLRHEDVVRETTIGQVGQPTCQHRPEAGLVGLGDSSGHAPALIGKIAHEESLPDDCRPPGLEPNGRRLPKEQLSSARA